VEKLGFHAISLAPGTFAFDFVHPLFLGVSLREELMLKIKAKLEIPLVIGGNNNQNI
jgi:hypothetical protein